MQQPKQGGMRRAQSGTDLGMELRHTQLLNQALTTACLGLDCAIRPRVLSYFIVGWEALVDARLCTPQPLQRNRDHKKSEFWLGIEIPMPRPRPMHPAC